MKLEDEKLSAWIDGALDEAEARQLAELAAQDEALANRAVQLRRIDDLVKNAIPEEGVPQDLLERLGLAGGATSNVVDFAAERTRRLAQPATLAPQRPAARFWDHRKVAAVLVLVATGLASAAWLNAPQPRQAEASYRVLGDAPQAAASANVLVMFDGNVDAGEARTIAASLGGSIAGGQTAAGAWKLAFDPARRDAAITALRARGDVTMAEPVDGGAR